MKRLAGRQSCIGRLLVALGAVMLTGSCSAQIPAKCRAPQALSSAMTAKSSAAVYDAVGAWFAEHNQQDCALSAFQRATILEPNSAEAHFNLGVAELRLKQLSDAEQQLRLAIKANPGLTAARLSLGTLLLDADRPQEAEAIFRELLIADPISFEGLDNLGLALAAQRRYAAAVRAWQQALAIRPGSPDTVLSMATAMYKDGDGKASVAILVDLLKTHPEMKEAHLTLANIYAKQEQYVNAAGEYGIAVRLDPRDDIARLAWAKALSTSGAFQEATAPAEEYISRHPEDADGHLVLGSVYRILGEFAKAERELAITVAAEPGNAHAEYELGSAYSRDGKLEKALSHLERAAALGPADSATEFAMAAVLRKLGDTKRASEVAALMMKNKEAERQRTTDTVIGNQANAALSGGQPMQAAEVYRRLLADDPRNARTEYNLALALAAVKDVRGEREALEKAVEFDPKMAVALSELGLLDIEATDLLSARKHLEAALAIDPQLATAQGNLGLVYAMRGDQATAERLLRLAIEDDPKYVQAYLNLGLVLASRGQFAAATEPLIVALKLAPKDVRVRSAMGKVKARLGLGDEAVALFRGNVELAPGAVDAHLELAIALADRYDLKGALAETDTALRLAPESVSANFNRGRILFDLGRVEEARISLERAGQLAPRAIEPRYYLALAYKRTAEYAKATTLFQAVVATQPDNVTAWYFLGQCLQQLGKEPEAIVAWRRAAAINPGYTPALWSLTRALARRDATESGLFNAQLKDAIKKAHSLDEAELAANNGIAAMQAHDWPGAIKGLKDAIRVCGDCAQTASLHKALGLIFCHAGDLDSAEKELHTAQALNAGDEEVLRALSLIARARAERSE